MAITLANPPIAPDVVLPVHAGGEFHLQDRRGVPGTTMLVFFRGHWCPYCRRYLTKLQENLPRFAQQKSLLIGISPEPLATSVQLARDLGLSFPILSDADGEAIARYGVRNGTFGILLPHPAVFIIDPDLRVRFRSIDRNFKKRTTIRSLFTALAEIGEPSIALAAT